MKIGVLDLGDYVYPGHAQIIRKCGLEVVAIQNSEQLDEIDGLIISAVEKQAQREITVAAEMHTKICARTDQGLPVFGTCAGLILLARKVQGEKKPLLGLMDITVKRNVFIFPQDSNKVDLIIPALGNNPIKAAFFNAPCIIKTAPNVGILCIYDNKIVMVRQGNYLACAFHPLSIDDLRVHQYFIKMVEDSLG